MVLRQVYRAGEGAFVDYAGPTFPIVDRSTGEVRDAVVSVGVPGASNYTFVDVTRSRSLPDWAMSHVRMFESWGGVPELVIPDNETAGVRKASRHEPDLNPTYQELATHYGTTELPARPRSPQDKAKVEAAVQQVERWIMAPLRNQTFFSLGELRRAIRPLLAALNERPFQKTEGSRRSWFEEIFHKHRRVAVHLRSHRKGGYATDAAHMPAAPRPPRLDPVAADRLGPEGRTRHGRLRRTTPREPAPPGAGLPQLPRPQGAAAGLWRQAPRRPPRPTSANCPSRTVSPCFLEREKTEREQRRYARLKGHPRLHLNTTIEDLNFKAPRGLDRSLVLRLASGQWIRDGQTLLVGGATGSGKSYLACALGHQACRIGISTRYYRVSRLLDELTLARADGSYPKLIQRLARTWLLVLDDWGLASLSGQGRHDLLEVLDDRYARRGTLLASQIPGEHWHECFRTVIT